MAFPQYIAKSAFASGTAALTVGAVSGAVADDLILLFIESANQPVTAPTGYLPIAGSPQQTGTAAAAGGVALQVYYRWATGADTTTSVADSGDHTTAIKVLIRGANRTTPFNITNGSVQATPAVNWTLPSVSTTTPECLIIFGIGNDRDAASTVNLSGFTNANLTNIAELHDQTVTSGVGGGIGIYEGEWANTGSIGTSTVINAVNNTAAFITLAIAPIASLDGTGTVTGDQGTSSAGTTSGKGDAVDAVTGTSATASAAGIAATGTTVAAVTGTSATASAATVTASGASVVNATASVTGSSATATPATISASGTVVVNATATVIGSSATATPATVSASGATVVNATASVTSTQATSAAQTISATGFATRVVGGTGATSSTATTNASGQAAATPTGSSASVTNPELTASGQATTEQISVSATAFVATISASAEDSVSAVATVNGAQATAQASTITASGAEKTVGGKTRRRRPTVPHLRIEHPKNAVAKVMGLDAFAVPGRVFAIGTVNGTAAVNTAGINSTTDTVTARGIQNPTDDQLLMLLLA